MPKASWLEVPFTEVIQIRSWGNCLDQISVIASEEHGSGVELTSAPAWKRRGAFLPTTHWLELMLAPCPALRGWGEETPNMCQGRERVEYGGTIWAFPLDGTEAESPAPACWCLTHWLQPSKTRRKAQCEGLGPLSISMALSHRQSLVTCVIASMILAAAELFIHVGAFVL